jgi:hypothetical protein
VGTSRALMSKATTNNICSNKHKTTWIYTACKHQNTTNFLKNPLRLSSFANEITVLHCYVLTFGRSVTAFPAPPRSQRPGQGPRSPHPKAGPVCKRPLKAMAEWWPVRDLSAYGLCYYHTQFQEVCYQKHTNLRLQWPMWNRAAFVMDEEKLIILVQGHECLYNLRHKDYDNNFPHPVPGS